LKDDEDALNVDRPAWRPSADSTATKEFATLVSAGVLEDALRNRGREDFSRTVSVARRLTESVIENLRNLALLLQDESAVRTPIALGRIVLDANARLWYVLEPNLDAFERVRRTLNEELSSIAHGYRALSDEDADALSNFEQRISEIRSVAVSCGFSSFQRMRSRNGRKRSLRISARLLRRRP
jgi:hypothetical protein